jgi:hypothetical protein
VTEEERGAMPWLQILTRWDIIMNGLFRRWGGMLVIRAMPRGRRLTTTAKVIHETGHGWMPGNPKMYLRIATYKGF